MCARVEIWWIFIGGADLYYIYIKAELCGKTDALITLKAQWSFPLECRVGKRTERKPLHQNTAKQKYKKS